MKQFDDIFREKVADAFISYNADQMADKGWQSFMAARRSRRWMIVFMPFWAKAASVAVIVGLGTFTAYHALKNHPDGEILTGTTTTGVIEDILTSVPNSQNPLTATPIPDVTDRKIEQGNKLTMSASNTYLLRPESASGVQKDGHPDEVAGPATNERLPVRSVHDIQPIQAGRLSTDNSLNLLSGLELMKSPGKQIAEQETIEPVSNKNKTRLMAGLSGMFAGSDEGTTGAQGLAFGFYVDRRITKRMSFRPGIALAMNTVNLYSNNISSAKIASSVTLYNGNAGILDHYEGHLNMLAMEIPLNFVFTVLERKKSGLFLTAGASTMVYLNQQFEGDFINEYTQQILNAATDLYTAETRYSTVSVSNDYGAFSRTDLLGLANFSAGYSFPYGKSGTFLIEPFVQIPLNDLTSLNLRVRYGGISMKLRFGDGSD